MRQRLSLRAFDICSFDVRDSLCPVYKAYTNSETINLESV